MLNRGLKVFKTYTRAVYLKYQSARKLKPTNTMNYKENDSINALALIKIKKQSLLKSILYTVVIGVIIVNTFSVISMFL